jgi:hypothetical protein
MKSFSAAIILFVLASFPDAIWGLSPQQTFNRRNFFQVAIATAGVATTSSSISMPAFALDMDAFANQQLTQDSPKKVSDDEIKRDGDGIKRDGDAIKRDDDEIKKDEMMCRYGAPGKPKGEACVRAGMPTSKGKGVDAFGNVDRGDFVRCTTTYPMIDGQYVKTVTCA